MYSSRDICTYRTFVTYCLLFSSVLYVTATCLKFKVVSHDVWASSQIRIQTRSQLLGKLVCFVSLLLTAADTALLVVKCRIVSATVLQYVHFSIANGLCPVTGSVVGVVFVNWTKAYWLLYLWCTKSSSSDIHLNDIVRKRRSRLDILKNGNTRKTFFLILSL